jgi:hypothetical protein
LQFLSPPFFASFLYFFSALLAQLLPQTNKSPAPALRKLADCQRGNM